MGRGKSRTRVPNLASRVGHLHFTHWGAPGTSTTRYCEVLPGTTQYAQVHGTLTLPVFLLFHCTRGMRLEPSTDSILYLFTIHYPLFPIFYLLSSILSATRLLRLKHLP